MQLNTRSETVTDSVGWLGSTEGLRFLVNGATLDASAFVADSQGKKIAPSGLPLGRLASGLYRPSINTTLSAAADELDTHVDVIDGRYLVPGQQIKIDGVAKVVHANGVDVGGGAGGSDRVPLTAALGVDKAAGLVVATYDGSEETRCLLWRSVDLTIGNAHGGAIDHGRVIESALPATLSAAQRLALQLRGITFD